MTETPDTRGELLAEAREATCRPWANYWENDGSFDIEIIEERARDLITRLAAALEGGWKPIEQLHAEVGDRIWGYGPTMKHVAEWQLPLRLSDDFPKAERLWVDEDGRVWFPTHFRPLPPPPTAPEGEGAK